MSHTHSSETGKRGWRNVFDGIFTKRSSAVIAEVIKPVPATEFVEVGGSTYAVNKNGSWGRERTQKELLSVAVGKWVTDMHKRVSADIYPATEEDLRQRFPTYMHMLDDGLTIAREENEDLVQNGREWPTLADETVSIHLTEKSASSASGSKEWFSLSAALRAQKEARGEDVFPPWNPLLRLDLEPDEFFLKMRHGNRLYLRKCSVTEDMEPLHTILRTPLLGGERYQKAYPHADSTFIQYSHPVFSSFETEGLGEDIDWDLWEEYKKDTLVAF